MRSICRSLLPVLLLMTCMPACSDDGSVGELDEKVYRKMKESIDREKAIQERLVLAAYADNGDTVKVATDLSDQDILVFKFSDSDCDLCIDSIAGYLSRNKTGIRMRLEVWNQVAGTKAMYADKSWYDNIENVRFRIVHQELNALTSNGQGKSYLFIYNGKDKTVRNIFFPNIDQFGNVERYLEIVEKKYRLHI
ncbi:MAG: hypothetical protein P0Y53_13720 [Candidatus Pseudobacter hemicellulosilyticus]|uniref:Uncharacterized protein n=1 Tax=Candidatus Pseudobacter hemicellulosilyticus TaxID=3121375 RepID=A0AAJ6BDD8_9BACT|nr:MAG: hypothetical protein P0Y53_13720 [Pseudobacter sp.]